MVQVYMHTHNTQGHIMTRHTTHTQADNTELRGLAYFSIKRAFTSLVPRPRPSYYARERTIEAFLVFDDVKLIIFTRRVT